MASEFMTAHRDGNRAASRVGGRNFTLPSSNIFVFLTCILFVATFALKSFTDAYYVSRDISNSLVNLKYLTALLCCITAFPCMAKSEHKGEIFSQEFNKLMLIFLLFCCVSGVLAFVTGIFSTQVLIELLKLGMPIVLGYFILNSLRLDQIYRCMQFVLVFAVMGYLLELQIKGASIFDLASADFAGSRSNTESSYSAGVAIMTSLFFSYFNRSKFWSVFSLIFCILTFKRLALVVSICAFLLMMFFPNRMRQGRVSKRFLTMLKFATLSIVALYTWLLLPEQSNLFSSIFGSTQSQLTQGRSLVLAYLIEGGFQSYGYGSATLASAAVFGSGFEMDLIKIAVELTPVTMIIFIWVFWDLVKESPWALVVVGYIMLNLITSDSLSSNFSMTLMYVLVGAVNYLGSPGLMCVEADSND